MSEAMELVPNSPPPVPFHTPQNMDIMAHAATAMNQAIVGDATPEESLSAAADQIEPLAAEIPDEYIS